MAATQLILLERVENLGQMGEIVSVKPGYARNFLLPQRKALRASKANVAYYEAQKKHLEAANIQKRGEAEKLAAKLGDFSVVILRQASEGGQLYGSVSTRDIAEAAMAAGVTIARDQVRLNQAYKTLGLFKVDVFLHAEVKIVLTVNIARTEEEAKIQAKTGRAVEAAAMKEAADAAAAEKAAFLEQDALAAEQAAAAQAAAIAEAEAKASAEKSAKRATKKAEKKSAETVDEAAAEETPE